MLVLNGSAYIKLAYLIKNCLSWADETPLEDGFLAVGIGRRPTNVKNLTFVGDVGVVSCKK